MKIMMATKNPGKIEGAKKAFSHYFENVEIVGISASSEVPDQPVNEELYLGAKNRVKNLKKYCLENNIQADLFISIESGLTIQLGSYLIINLAVIEDNDLFSSIGTSAGFPVPETLVSEIKNSDLNEVMTKIFEENDLRSSKGGISYLTQDQISRIDLTEQAFIMALTKYINLSWQDEKKVN